MDALFDDNAIDQDAIPGTYKRMRTKTAILSPSVHHQIGGPSTAIHPGSTKRPLGDKPYYLFYSLRGFIQLRNMGDYNVVQVLLGPQNGNS